MKTLRPNVHLTAEQGDAYRALVQEARECLRIANLKGLNSGPRFQAISERLFNALAAVEEAEKASTA